MHLTALTGGTHVAALLAAGGLEIWRGSAERDGTLEYSREACLQLQAAHACLWLSSPRLQLAAAMSSGYVLLDLAAAPPALMFGAGCSACELHCAADTLHWSARHGAAPGRLTFLLPALAALLLHTAPASPLDLTTACSWPQGPSSLSTPASQVNGTCLPALGSVWSSTC